jgi:hypothetical protein
MVTVGRLPTADSGQSVLVIALADHTRLVAALQNWKFRIVDGQGDDEWSS